MSAKAPFLWILLAGILWGTTGTAQTFAPGTPSPIAIGAIRLLIGGLSLLIIVIFLGKFKLNNLPMRRILMAALTMACYQPLFFTAVKTTGVAIGTVIAIGSAPILTGLLEWLIVKKSPSRIWWYATFLSIIGCLLLFVNDTGINIDPLGIIMAIGAGLSFASYTFVTKGLIETHSPLTVVAIVFTLSAVILSPVLFIYDLNWLLEIRGLMVSLHLGVMTTSVAYLLFTRGLSFVPSSTAVTLSLVEPLTAALLGVFLVGETLTPTSWMGIGLLFLGISLLTVKNENPI